MNDEDPNIDQTQSFLVLTSGMQVSHYRIVNKIGSGGMGEVYLAEDDQLKRKVALKFLREYMATEGTSRARFLREAQAAAALDHDNIVTIHEVGEYNSRPFFAMQYIEGRSLRQILKDGPLDLSRAVQYGIQMCKGLSEAHSCGVVHRDVKPSNVVVDAHDRVRLLDFGLASVRGGEQLTRGGTAMGTLGYTAPEIIRGGEVDARSDIFSVGVVLYELITGKQPFARDDEAATLHAIAYESPEPIESIQEDVPIRLSRIVEKSLAKDQDKRFQTVDALLSELEAVGQEIEEGSYRSSGRVLRLARAWRRRRPVPVMVLVALTLLLLALIPSTRNWFVDQLGGGRVPEIRHLAVLPFHDFGNPSVGQPFCDGLMETLSSKLTQMEQFHGSLWVVPASEVRAQSVSGIQEARKRFGVNLAVSGSIQQLGESVRLTLNLVDAKTSRQLRASVSDYAMADLESLQDSTVVVLADMLELHLQPADNRVLRAGETDVPEAYDLYVRGRGYLQHAEKLANVDTAIELFNRALGYDAEYVLALAGLGEAYWEKYSIETDPAFRDLAITTSRRAVALNDKVSPAHVTLGIIYNGTGRYEQAVEALTGALALDSANRAACLELARALVSLNRLDSAEAVYKRAIDIRPGHWSGYERLGMFYVNHGRYEEAEVQADRAVALEPQGYDAWNNLGGLYYFIGDVDRAIAMWERSVAIDPNYSALSNLGTVHLMRSEYVEAEEHYRRALNLNPSDYRVWLNYGVVLRQIPEADDRADDAYGEGIARGEAKRRINPTDHMLLSELADAYAAIDQPDSAVKLIEGALLMAPENQQVMVTAGSVYEQIGEREKAITMIVGALERGYPREQIESTSDLSELTDDPVFDSLLSAGQPPPDETQ